MRSQPDGGQAEAREAANRSQTARTDGQQIGEEPHSAPGQQQHSNRRTDHTHSDSGTARQQTAHRSPGNPQRSPSVNQPTHGQQTHQQPSGGWFEIGRLPTGLTILAIALGCSGVLSLFGGLNLLGASSAAYGMSSSFQNAGLALLGLGVVSTGAAYGILNLKPWGYTVGLAAIGVGVAGPIVIFGGAAIGGVLFYVGMGWYLYTQRDRYQRLTANGTTPSQRVA